GGRPSKRKPDSPATQRTGWPLRRERARADSSRAARRWASRSSGSPAASRSAKATPAEAKATMAITTSSSSRVKPAGGRRMRAAALLPGADVGILALAARLAVGAEGHHVDLALDAGIEVLVRPAPRVVGQLFEVGLPVRRGRPGRGLGDQRLQPLFAGG